jgi:hypothetical protein
MRQGRLSEPSPHACPLDASMDGSESRPYVIEAR